MQHLQPMLHPLYLSIKVASIATIIAFFLGILLAWLFVFHKNKWTSILSQLTMLPLVLPPTVLGYYILLMIGRNSMLGQWIETMTGEPIVFTWKAAVIAAVIASLPLLIRPIQVAFESIDEKIIQAASLDGANRWQMLIHIIIPLAHKGILAGIILGFARAIGEFGATLMVAGNIPTKTQTLSIAIYDAVQANRMSEAHLMVIILSLVTISILLLMSQWLTKR